MQAVVRQAAQWIEVIQKPGGRVAEVTEREE
jgi:hypothetical protein